MIIIAPHLDAAARGIDVSTDAKMIDYLKDRLLQAQRRENALRSLIARREKHVREYFSLEGSSGL